MQHDWVGTRRVWLVSVGIVLLALVGAAQFQRGAQADTARAATVALVPIGQARAGQRLTVQLVASGASNVAGFQAMVRFGPMPLRLMGATVEEELTRGGRDLVPLGPVLREAEGTVVLGAATCPVSECAEGYPFDATRQPVGVSGRIVLATLTFYAPQPGAYELSLDGVQVVDPQGEPLAARTESVLRLTVGE